MSEPRLIRVVRTQPGWGAKCRPCGKWLTKWDFTRDDALAVARAEKHRCGE